MLGKSGWLLISCFVLTLLGLSSKIGTGEWLAETRDGVKRMAFRDGLIGGMLGIHGLEDVETGFTSSAFDGERFRV